MPDSAQLLAAGWLEAGNGNVYFTYGKSYL